MDKKRKKAIFQLLHEIKILVDISWSSLLNACNFWSWNSKKRNDLVAIFETAIIRIDFWDDVTLSPEISSFFYKNEENKMHLKKRCAPIMEKYSSSLDHHHQFV